MFTVAVFLPSMAYAIDDGALPSNGNIVSGNVSFDYSIANQLHVQQNSDRAIINWDSFNIGKNALTEFHQKNSSSLAVNRVTGFGIDPTQILGALKANGIVMVLDQNGVIFGKDSVVDVGGIIASTGNINDADFMSGQDIFELHNIDTIGSIINEGTITVAEGGLAAFVAPHLVNNGVIEAKMGRVAFASGTQATLDLYGDGLVEIAVDDNLSNVLIENNGIINTKGGSVFVSVPTVQNVVDNIINMDGVINVSSITQKGGKIILEGGNINVAGNLNANGKTSGGEIHVGGEYLGGGDTAHAQKVTVSENAIIEASATDIGDGGEVIIWSDQETWMAGTIKALGGSLSGNGGFIETSSKDYLRIRGYADASAVNGLAGQWLLDPSNVSIVNGAGFDASAGGTVNPTTDSYTVDADTIQTALNAGTSVTITTTNGAGTEAGDITMTGATINKTAGADTSLTLQADNSVILNNSSITSTTGALDVILHADSDNNDIGYVSVTNNSTITTNGGEFIAGGGLNPLTDYAWGTVAMTQGVEIKGSDITTGAGDISIMGHGWNDAASSNLMGVDVSQGSVLSSTTGQIILDGIGGDGAINNFGVVVGGTNTDINSVDGDISITGQGGSAGIGDSRNNYGAYIIGSEIKSTGTGVGAGTITIDGTGADGARRNHGVYIGQNNTEITSIDGDINITGQGGDGSTDENYGVFVLANADISSTGVGANAANININGTGGASRRYNYGVYMRDAGTTVTTVDGDLLITGRGGSDGTNTSNYGLYITLGSGISSAGAGASAGTITVDGTGGNGTNTNYGVYLTDAGTTVSSADGDIGITGQGQGSGVNNDDFVIDNAGITTTNSDIRLNIDTHNFLNAASVSSGNNLIITPRTTAASIGLGSAVGTLSLDNTDLAFFSASGAVRIGEVTSASTINVDNVDVSGAGYDIEIIGGQITVDNGLTGGGSVFLQSTAAQDIILNSAVQAAGAGNSLVIITDDELINNFGAGALNSGAGRYLAYIKDYKTFTANGLTGSNIYGRSYGSYPPASVPVGGNRFIFENSPVVASSNSVPQHNIENYVVQIIEKNTVKRAKNSLGEYVVNEDESYAGVSCLVSYSDSGACAIQ